MTSTRHIACLLSGSTESAVAAFLLKKSGYNVLGIFVKNPFKSSCQTEEEFSFANKVSHHLEIPLQELSLPKEDWDQFLSSVTSDYKKGYLSSVDILYNKHVTFGSLFNYVTKQIGVDGLATGHYARRSHPGDLTSQVRRRGVKLYKAFDQLHDQSVLLSQVPQKYLQRILMPIGELPPSVIPKLAQSVGLPVAQGSKDTYVDKDLLLAAVNEKVAKKAGNFINLISGAVEGKHQGVQDYAVGDIIQIEEQVFCVVSTDGESGDVTVALGKDHPALYVDTLFTSLAHWIHSVPYSFYKKHTMDCEFRVKMLQSIMQCTLTVGTPDWCGNDHIILSSTCPLKSVNPGHYAVFYKGDECIGSAKILRPGPSQYVMNFKNITNNYSRTQTKPSGFTFSTFFKKILNS